MQAVFFSWSKLMINWPRYHLTPWSHDQDLINPFTTFDQLIRLLSDTLFTWSTCCLLKWNSTFWQPLKISNLEFEIETVFFFIVNSECANDSIVLTFFSVYHLVNRVIHTKKKNRSAAFQIWYWLEKLKSNSPKKPTKHSAAIFVQPTMQILKTLPSCSMQNK